MCLMVTMGQSSLMGRQAVGKPTLLWVKSTLSRKKGLSYVLCKAPKPPKNYFLTYFPSEQIFNHIQNSEIGINYVIICSILEIYKDNLFDLLRENDQELKIKESPTKGIYVDGLTKISVISQEELFQVIKQGNKMKTVAQTRFNSQSSRSHTIF